MKLNPTQVLLALAMLLPMASQSAGSHAVKGYIKKDGTYVAPHRQTNSNTTQKDNWSSKPNVNPYTGKKGTKEAEK
jgi:hypothetical protein